MILARTLAHLFLPRDSNNHKAKMLHNSGLFYLKMFLILFQVGIFLIARIPGPGVLGFSANISPNEIIRLINEKRVQNGLSVLSENGILSSAAQAKGTDMLNRDYWAHVAPDGTQPWIFFSNVGYKYRFAGENLAKDFSNPTSAVEAWMASQTHRDNILSANYKETGVAVVEGDLAGVSTTIIVQLFGTTLSGVPATSPIAAKTKTAPSTTSAPIAGTNTISTPIPTGTPVAIPTNIPFVLIEATPLVQIQETQRVLISPFVTTKGVSLVTILLLLMIMVLDFVITAKRKTARIGGKTFAHISFLGMLLVIVIILKAGNIL